MGVFRALLFATLIIAQPFCASAQFGGMPGLPGDTPGGVPGVGGFHGPPAGPPPACRDLLAMRDEVQKHGTAIQKANERKATVQEACKLFRSFLGAETKFIKSLEENTRTCGVPGDAIKQAKEGHAKALQVGKQVCDAAAQGPRPSGPTGDFWWLGELEQKSGQFRDHEDYCRDCRKTGDFWWTIPPPGFR
jgi:hypothetical protein